jgi:arsenate reductase
MTFTLFHNRNCSKSRECLKILHANKVKLSVREYIKQPLSENELKHIVNNLEGDLSNLVRRNNDEENLFSSKNKLVKYLLINQKYLQRPIFFNKKKYIICRPPDLVINYL